METEPGGGGGGGVFWDLYPHLLLYDLQFLLINPYPPVFSSQLTVTRIPWKTFSLLWTWFSLYFFLFFSFFRLFFSGFLSFFLLSPSFFLSFTYFFSLVFLSSLVLSFLSFFGYFLFSFFTSFGMTLSGSLVFEMMSISPCLWAESSHQRLSMELDLQSLFGLHVHSCTN